MIDYEQSLNPAQYAAATVADGPALVIAGAGSGKTRTVVYRMAWLCEQGVEPHHMLLLTFTRKAAQEMMHRAGLLLDRGLMGVRGGTFHAFAYATLRQYRPAWLEGRNFSVMDSGDMTSALSHCRDAHKIGKGDRSFPKNQNILGIFSKARNKELSVSEVLQKELPHLEVHAEALEQLYCVYSDFRRAQCIFDYDDLLFELEGLLQENSVEVQSLRERLRYIMVDEYQDTNKVQARLVRLLGASECGGCGNVMAVGDDAQSIYAFRGAYVRNILDFSQFFPGAQVIRLEENYRSTQPVLSVANSLLSHAAEHYDKNLFTRREGGAPVRVVIPQSDQSQAQVVVRRIEELLKQFVPHEIAVLFRASFHSYNLEVALKHANIPFRKVGGIRFAEAAHIKDALSYARLIVNPRDRQAFERIAVLHKGIGKKTVEKLHIALTTKPLKDIEKAFARYGGLWEDMCFITTQRSRMLSPEALMQEIVEHYVPHLTAQYPDDWPRRRQGLDEIIHMASSHTNVDEFIADIVLDPSDAPQEGDETKALDQEQFITLSTIHSAKGLEWGAVIIIDLVEDRFPSRHAFDNAEVFEEERRLMYVACTRARSVLELYAPSSVYNRAFRTTEYSSPSPFLQELPRDLYEEWYESYGNVLKRRGGARGAGKAASKKATSAKAPASSAGASPILSEVGEADGTSLSYCYHKVFGRGKIVRMMPPDKCQVNFQNFGLKVILKEFLTMDNVQ